MKDVETVLKEAGVRDTLTEKVLAYRNRYPVEEEYRNRIPSPSYMYYGETVWNKALAALMAGENLLLAGEKATGKNVLCECLGYVLGRPCWNVGFHINADASYLIGTDTYDGTRVTFRPGPVYESAAHGGICILDEVNMAKNEALAVLHATLDYRRIIEVPGYQKIDVAPSARFIGTMNYGYAGTRDLNEALASRFAILEMPVIQEEDLKKLIDTRYPEMRPEIRNQFTELFYELQKKAEHGDITERAVDLRGLLDSIHLMEMGVNSGESLEMCLVNKTFDSYERGLVQDVIQARIAPDLTADIVFGKQ